MRQRSRRKLVIPLIVGLGLLVILFGANVAGVEYDLNIVQRIAKPHSPVTVELVNSQLKLVSVNVNWTSNTIIAQVYNNNTVEEKSMLYVGVNNITGAVWSSLGIPYTVPAQSTVTVNVACPIQLVKMYLIIVTW